MSETAHEVRPALTTVWLTLGTLLLIGVGVALKFFGVRGGAIALLVAVLLVVGPIRLFLRRVRMERVGRTVFIHKVVGTPRKIECGDVAAAGVYTVRNGTPATTDQRLLVRFHSGEPSFMMRGMRDWNVEKLQWLFAGGGVDLANVPGVATKKDLAEHFPGAF